MNKLTLLSLLLLLLAGVRPGFAQKTCDLELSYVNPAPNSELPYGDTLWLVCGIKNNGPDDLDLSDTIYYAWDNQPIIRVTYGVIPAGSTLNDTIMYGTSDQYENEIFDFCHFFLHEEHTTFVDSIAANDIACIQFVALGSVKTDKKALSISGPIPGLYPQPAHDYLNIQLEPGAGPDKIVITDIAGRIVLQEERLERLGENLYRLHVGTLNQGMYMLQLQSKEGKSTTAKIVIW